MCVCVCVRLVHGSLQINDITGGTSDEAGDRGGRVHVLIDPGRGTAPRQGGLTRTGTGSLDVIWQRLSAESGDNRIIPHWKESAAVQQLAGDVGRTACRPFTPTIPLDFISTSLIKFCISVFGDIVATGIMLDWMTDQNPHTNHKTPRS